MAFLEFKPTQTVYKYCSSDGFLGIVKSKRLWFTDLASANDPREIKLGYELFAEAINLVRQEDLKGLRGAFLANLGKELADVHTSQQAFSCCLSLVADALPMWNEYGKNYSGLAIGFRPSSLFGIPCRIQRAKYLDADTIEGFKKAVQSFANQYAAIPRAANDLNFWIPTAVAAFASMTALKHTTWAYENELRLVYSQVRKPPDRMDDPISSTISMWPDNTPVKWAKPLERLSGGNAIEYLEFPFGKFDHGVFRPERAIKTVILGPRCALGEAEVAVAMKDNGFEDFQVVASDCQIR